MMNNAIANQQVRQRFNRCWQTYDKHAIVQQIIGQQLIKLVKKNKSQYSTILDVACGTGFSTDTIVKQLSYKKLFAIDFSNQLIKLAKQRLRQQNIHFILADFNRPCLQSNCIDLIVSNMGLQWSSNLQQTFSLFNRYLTNGGILAFSLPLTGTFSELKANCRLPLASFQCVKAQLEQTGFTIQAYQAYSHIETFNSAFAAIASIKAVGANSNVNAKPKNHLTSTRQLNQLFVNQHQIQLSYYIGNFIVNKREHIHA